MPIIVGKQPTSWKDSASRPTQDFSFLRGGGISGGGAPLEFTTERPKGRQPQSEEEFEEKQRKKALEGENLAEMTVEEVLDSDIELGVGTWTAPVLDADAVLPSYIESGQLTVGIIKAEYINVDQLSAIAADMGTITAGNITLGTDGFIKGGQTDYGTGTGFFLGYSGAAYKFSIGVGAGGLTWDGTDLNVNGNTVNADTLQISSTTVNTSANQLNALGGQDNLLYIPSNLMEIDTFGGTVGTFNNGFTFVGSGASADDESAVILGDATLGGPQISDKFIGAFDMSSTFDIQSRLLYTEQGTWSSSQDGSFLWVGWANIGATFGVFVSKADLATVDHAGLFIEYTDGVGWTAYLKTGNGTTTTETSLGTSYAPTTERVYRVEFDGTTVTAYVDGVSIGTSTTNLPNETNATYGTLVRSFSESAGSSPTHDLDVTNPQAMITVK